MDGADLNTEREFMFNVGLSLKTLSQYHTHSSSVLNTVLLVSDCLLSCETVAIQAARKDKICCFAPAGFEPTGL